MSSELSRQTVVEEGRLRPSVIPQDVLVEVAREFGVSKQRVRSRKRKGRAVCMARDELCRRLKHLGYSNTDIGNFLCRRDPSTITKAIDRANARLANAELPE